MAIPTYSLNLIRSLQPAVQPIIQNLLDQCEAAGIPCDIVQGTRTMAEQQAVYAQGRVTPGPVVSNAKPGDSFHNYGLAVDIVPRVYKSMPNWNPSGPYWDRIGAIGRSLGLEWGGDWSKPDKPHFHLPAAPLAELKAYWEKFKSIMPITITPSEGGVAIGLALVAVWFMLRPKLERAGIL